MIGAVGSGKSSLLSAIVASLDKIKGRIKVENIANGVGLVTQEPWIQHATIRYATSSRFGLNVFTKCILSVGHH